VAWRGELLESVSCELKNWLHYAIAALLNDHLTIRQLDIPLPLFFNLDTCVSILDTKKKGYIAQLLNCQSAKSGVNSAPVPTRRGHPACPADLLRG